MLGGDSCLLLVVPCWVVVGCGCTLFVCLLDWVRDCVIICLCGSFAGGLVGWQWFSIRVVLLGVLGRLRGVILLI